MNVSLNVLLAARMALPLEFTEVVDTTASDTAVTDVAAMIQLYQDSAVAGFTYENGTVQLENGVAPSRSRMVSNS